MTDTNPVQAAINAAKAAAAANTPADTANAVPMVATTPAGSAVTTYQPAAAPSLMGLTKGAMSVDDYLKVKEHGLLIGAKTDLIEEIEVTIDMNEVQPFEGVRYSVGNNVQYLKSYDGVNCSSGGTWTQAVAKAQAVDPSTRPYNGADIPMTLLKDAKSIKGTVVAEAGVRLGHTTSITNRAALGDFIKNVDKAGWIKQTVKAKLTAKRMTNSKGQVWGIIEFELLDIAE